MWNTRKFEEIDFFSIRAGDRVQVKRHHASRFSNEYIVKDVEDTVVGRVIQPISGNSFFESTDADSMFRLVL